MATLRTPEDTAQQILAIFRRFNIQPGHWLLFNSVREPFGRGTLRASDIFPGIDWLVARGFIEDRANRYGPYILTRAGFDARPDFWKN